MKYSKTQLKDIASITSSLPLDSRIMVSERFCQLFIRTNSEFDVDKFVDACGLKGEVSIKEVMEEVNKRKFNRFTPGFAGMKGGTFRCSDCGKLTRDTGENGSVGLCPKCYKECIEENVISDYGEQKLQEMRRKGDI